MTLSISNQKNYLQINILLENDLPISKVDNMSTNIRLNPLTIKDKALSLQSLKIRDRTYL